jgi:hypothetical protein
MTKKQPRFIFLLSVLIFFALPSSGGITQARSVVSRDPEIATDAAENLSFCQNVEVSRTDAICESAYGFSARLDFPQVDVDSVLAGKQFFPANEATFYADDQVINGAQYRNISFVLRWESTTPDFLQVYMTEIEPAWEGKGVPYRLLWRAGYETCAADSCETWTQVKDRGEYLPLDIPDLPEGLAADSNFNGVPASFWNTNLTVKNVLLFVRSSHSDLSLRS